MKNLDRQHWILRSYIALARYERYEPAGSYTDEALRADVCGEAAAVCNLCWDEPTEIAKIVYKVWGFTASQQFEKGIIAQPGKIANLLICSDLRRVFGDLSGIEGFDEKGNFKRDRFNDILVPIFEGRRIVGFKGYASRILRKELAKEAV